MVKFESFLTQLFLEQRIEHNGGGARIFEAAKAGNLL